MTKVLLQQLDPHVALYRDPRSGIAWVENGHDGCGYSAHPNIDASGSIRGMKASGHWGKHDRVVRSHSFLYSIDIAVGIARPSLLAAKHSRCGGTHYQE